MFVTLKVQKVKRSWNVINLIANYFTFFFFLLQKQLLIFRISQIREAEISISYSNITILNLVPR